MTKTRKALLLTATIFASLQMIASASPALAATEAPAAITTTVDGSDILWVEATVADGHEGQVKTKIFTPRNSKGHRTLVQTCTFPNTGAGNYRCGMDVADGSYAAKRSGNWVAKVIVGSQQLDREKFSL